jgi:hypothetical protein
LTAPAKKSVATPSAEYECSAAAWKLPRTLMGGTRAMRMAGRDYLPIEAGESDPAYQARLNRTTLFNAFRKTVKDLAGKVFTKPIVLNADVPPTLVTYAENIDLAGRNLNVFAFDVFLDGLQAGISFILGEMPPAVEGQTRADEKKTGRRPYLVHIKAESLIGWKSDVINGQETLTQIRISECVTEPDAENPYEEAEIEQIRVLEPGRWEIWRRSDKDRTEWVLHAQGPTTLDYIPLAPVYIRRKGFMLGEPPLEDLADLNVAHWQSQSDQRNILHVARVPILFGAGFDENATLVVGANTMARASNEKATLQYVEHTGKAIGSGENDLKSLETQMQAMGLQLVMPTPGGETATGAIIDDVKENSPLAMMAHALQDAIEQALGFMAEYDGLGKDQGGSVVVNTEFGMTTRGATDLADLVNAADKGLITPETFVREAQRRGVISEDIDPKNEADAAEALKTSRMKLEAETAAALRPAPPAAAKKPKPKSKAA